MSEDHVLGADSVAAQMKSIHMQAVDAKSKDSQRMENLQTSVITTTHRALGEDPFPVVPDANPGMNTYKFKEEGIEEIEDGFMQCCQKAIKDANGSVIWDK